MGTISNFESLESPLIKGSKINSFRCLILDINESNDQNFFKFKLLLNKEINEEFLVKKKLLLNTINMKEKDTEKVPLIKQEEEIKLIKDYSFEDYDLNQIKNQITNYYIMIDEVKGLFKKVNAEKKMFAEILKFRIKEKNIEKIDIKAYNIFYFINSVYIGFVALISQYKKKVFFSTYLTCLGKNKNNKQYEYQDLNGEIIKLDKKLEKNKIYFFNKLLYNPNNKKFSFIENLSFYEEINESLTTNSKVFQVNKESNMIIEGKVIDAKYSENKIIVKVLNSVNNNKIINIELNNNLMKSITFHGTTFFLNFQSKENNIYVPNKFSHLIQEEKTIIEIHFIDYQLRNKYDMIKINSQIFAINNNILIIELNKNQEKSYFKEKLIYMNKNKEIHIF